MCWVWFEWGYFGRLDSFRVGLFIVCVICWLFGLSLLFGGFGWVCVAGFVVGFVGVVDLWITFVWIVSCCFDLIVYLV